MAPSTEPVARMGGGWLALALILANCMTSQATHAPDVASREEPAEGIHGDTREKGRHASSHSIIMSEMANLATGYIRKGECPNWNEALAIAQRKMGCSKDDPPPSNACQEKLPCDVCQFLREGSWPPAYIVDFPAGEQRGKQATVLGAVLPDPRWQEICPVDDKTRAEFKASLCRERTVLGLDRIDTLAKAMVHEALHLCKFTGGTLPAVTDKGFWDYLYCGMVYGNLSVDAADLVEICWESGN